MTSPDKHSNEHLKVTAQALHEHSQCLQLLASQIQDHAFYTLDTNGCITSWNQGAERIKGYAEQDVIGQHCALFYPPEDIARGVPEQELLLARERQFEVEGWRVRKDGSRFLAHLIIAPLTDLDGAFCGYAKITRDISSRHKFEERFYQIVNSAPNAMVMVDRNGRIDMVNSQAEKLFLYPRTEMLGRPIEMLIPGQFRPQHPALRKAFFAEPDTRPMGKGRDLFALRKDGTEFPVEIGLNPIETDQGTKVLSAIVDISERRQKELKIEAALEEKNILLGEIHHRVKNNLQVVHSLLDLQSSQIDDPTAREMLLDSQNRIRSMSLIHQSLYQSKNFAKVNFSTVLETLVPTLIQCYRKDSQEVQFEIHAEEVAIPLNQAIPCGLIVNELVTNVIKHAFTDQQAGHVSIQLTQEANQAILSISDNGVGIPAELDLQQSNTLGLQLVRLLTDQLGAELSIQRVDPTRFTIRFKLEEV